MTVFVCPAGSVHTQTVALSTNQYPSCSAGDGSWQSVSVQEPFDPASLSSAELGGAYGSGFVVMATGLVIVFAARIIIRAIKTAL